MAINDELLDQLIAGYKKPEDLIGENGLLKQLTKRLLERAMQVEMTEHLGYAKNKPSGQKTGNSRNGTSKKKIKGDFGEIDLAVPRDRNSSFEPVIIPKGETRFKGFDDKIISMYARGMTTRDIQTHLEEMYGVDVSPPLFLKSQKLLRKKCGSGRTVRWTISIPLSIWMPSGSKSSTMDRLSPRQYTWP